VGQIHLGGLAILFDNQNDVMNTDIFVFPIMKWASIFVFSVFFLTVSWTLGYTHSQEKLSPKLNQTANELERVRDSLKKTKNRLRWYTSGPPSPDKMDDETIWFARVLFSETNRRREMSVLSWSVRNRVNTCFRGNCTYEDVAQDPWQYSGLHPSHPNYERNMINLASSKKEWQTALKMAWAVRHAPEVMNIFDGRARHFWSPRSMSTTPLWAHGENSQVLLRSEPMQKIPQKSRFVIYTGISDSS
jgi:hypothetical protein